MRLTDRFIVPERPEGGFVTPAKKAVPYTVTVIGGKEDLVKWKAEQALLAEARAVATTKAYAVRREIAVDMVKSQSTTTLSLTEAEKAEIRLKNVTAKTSLDSIDEAQKMPNGYTPERTEKIANEIKTIEQPKTVECGLTEAPKPTTAWDTLRALPGKVWRNAFDSER